MPLFAITGTFTSITVIAYLYITSRHKIRMALIQHGQRAEIFKENSEANSALKWGMVAVGLGLGLFLGGFMDWVGIGNEATYFGTMLMLGGAGLILYYNITKKKSGASSEEMV